MPHCLYCNAEIAEKDAWMIPWEGHRVHARRADEDGYENAPPLLMACSENHLKKSLAILADAEQKRGAFVFGIAGAAVIYPILAAVGYPFFERLLEWLGLWKEYTPRAHAGLILFLFGIDWGAGLLLYPYPTNEPGGMLGLLRSVWIFRLLGALLLAGSIAFYFTWNLWEV